MAVLTALLAAGAAACALAANPQPPLYGLPWPLLIAGFFAAEVLVLHLLLRREAHSYTLSEVVLVLGLAAVPVPLVIAARLLGAGTALVVSRKQRGTKLGFNLALYALEVAVAALLYGLMPLNASFGQRVPALGGSVFVATLLGLGCVLVVIRVASGTLTRAAFVETIGTGLVTAGLNVTFGLVVVAVLGGLPQLAWILLAPTVLLALGYRQLGRLHMDRGRVEDLYDFSRTLARSAELDIAATELANTARELLRAEHSWVRLVGPSGEVLHLAASAEADPPPALPHSLESITGPSLLTNTSGLAVAALRDAGIRDAVVAPLAGDGISGSVLVADSMGDYRLFGAADLQLLEALASQTNTVLRTGELIERLRTTAAERAYEAFHDTLTGLPNRALFRDRTLDAIEAAQQHGHQCAVMLMDLDRFKEVNDTLGHHTGDQLLRQVGHRLQEALGQDGVIARLGGDEFAVLLPVVEGSEAAVQTARRLRDSVRPPFTLGFMTLDVDLSLGLAVYPEHGAEPESLLQRADVAMYVAKAGTGEPEVYSIAQDRYNPRRLQLVGEMRRAIEHGELVLHYQPKVNLLTGRVVGVEALVRWDHPTDGLIPPDEWVPAVEQTEQLRPFTREVLTQALEQLVEWKQHGLDLGLAVNLSARSLLDPDLPSDVARLVAEAGVDPSRVTLELTESTLITESARSARVLTTLGAMRVKLSIDDFGTGYSSLTHLRRLPVDEVKVDKSFVTGMLQDQQDATIVKSLIELAQNLRMEVVAEGVEDEQTYRALRGLGCDNAQGYFLSRPLPPDDLVLWLEEWHARQGPLGYAVPRGAFPPRS